MSVFNEQPPIINKKSFILWLKSNYSFLNYKSITLNNLNSERDRNYLLCFNKKKKYVVKISNTAEKLEFLKYQDKLINHLNKNKNINSYIPNVCHKKILQIKDQNNKSCYVRILTFIEGSLYAKSIINENIENSLGNLLGYSSFQLQSFIDENSIRKFEWDPSNILWISKYINKFKNYKKEIIINSLKEFKLFVKPNLKNLRYSVTHADPNNYNLIVKNNKVTGLLDFGDSIYAPTINDLAICLSYALMNKNDLYLSLKNIISSYHKIFPINENEIFSLMSLCKSRLLITVVMAKLQKIKYPDNKYLSISENDAWKLLIKLNKINPKFLICIINKICNYPVIKNQNNIINFIKKTKFANIFNFDLLSVNKSILRLHSKSSLLKSNISNKELSIRIRKLLKKENSFLGIGLYKEKRKLYKSENFQSLLNNNAKRQIHLGIDFFIEKGESIYAPLDGKIVLLNDNKSKFDYGPTLILEHKDKNVKFFTLYGHLSKKTLTKLKLGQLIKKGELIAHVGSYVENGKWPPHLHFQIILDLMNEYKNFTGVAEEFLLDVWSSISPDPNLIFKLPNSFFSNTIKFDHLLKIRNKNIPNNFSISYEKPLHFLESKNQYLYDSFGKKYLDCVNNISHVGHSHPKIQKIINDQNKKLNTNTRYLYDIINVYSEKILKTFPKKLNKIFFVCTGSEANDLAYRISRTYTNAKDVLVMDNAYHGHTNSLIDISPYKFNGKGGEGKKEYVHLLDMPDPIRGKWKYNNKNWIKKYINDAINEINFINKSQKLSCFFVESILGCGGQIILPKNYLNQIFKAVRKNRGLCIVDEVQTGFGRVGNNFWAFEDYNVLPDIVTLGKPMGNGHPIAAVVTTEKIASAFDNGMEYFNSFGGNPVSCAVGNCVLDIIKDENLQLNAFEVGNYFLKSLKFLQKIHNKHISEVRGRGLFLGIDIIKKGNNLLPDNIKAKKLINYMRLQGILLSTDGPYDNVIKIKPPMVFTKQNVDFVCDNLNNFFKKI